MMDIDGFMQRLPAERREKIVVRVRQLKAEMLLKFLDDPEIAENFSIMECIRFLEFLSAPLSGDLETIP